MKDIEYTSEWEDGTCLTTSGRFDPKTMHVFDVEMSDDDADHGNLIVEFITLPNGDTLDSSDGLIFEYKEE